MLRCVSWRADNTRFTLAPRCEKRLRIFSTGLPFERNILSLVMDVPRRCYNGWMRKLVL